jgi:hypothetical protein
MRSRQKEINFEELRATLDKENKVAVKGEKLLFSFAPKKGAVFSKIKFAGEKCTIKETALELSNGNKLGSRGSSSSKRKIGTLKGRTNPSN